MAVVADVGLGARYLCLALIRLPSVGVNVLSSWELGERERYEGGGVGYFLFFPYSFGVGGSVLVRYSPTLHLKQWHNWKVGTLRGCCFPFPESLRDW